MQRHRSFLWRSAALGLTALLLAACPGSATFRRDGAAPPADKGKLPVYDVGGWKVGDTKSPPKTDGKPKGDLPKADLALGKQAGDPCPCAAPLLCVQKACRQPCTEQVCNGASTCPAGELCAPTVTGTAVCVPGGATGAACTATQPCAGGNLCLGKSGGGTTGQCYATCAGAGQPCAAGTCTAVPSSTCFFCQL